MKYEGLLKRVKPAMRYLLRGSMPDSAQTSADRMFTERKRPPDDERCEMHDLRWRCANRWRFIMMSPKGTARLVCSLHRKDMLVAGWGYHPDSKTGL